MDNAFKFLTGDDEKNLAEKSVEHYDKFMAAHPGDPLGENLPTIVGQAFLGKNNSDKAMEYFKAQVALFPKSRFAADAVMRQALTLIPLERFDEAFEILRKFLAGSPTKEQAAAAELGLATIHQKTNKTEEAIKTFKAVREKYPGTPEAEQASFFVAQMTLGSGDPKTAAEEFSSFIKNFPESELVPPAMLLLGQSQAEAGQKDAAGQTYKELAAKHPKSEQVPASYFQRAALRQKNGDLPGIKAVMREFIAAYPESDRLFSAYDYMAQIELSEKKPLEAIALYEEFASQRPDDAETPTALLRIAAQWKKYGEGQGPYLALTEEQRAEWRKGIENSMAVSEKVLAKYPESPAVALALQNLLACQKLQVRGKLKTDVNIEEYFQDLAKKFEAKPATRNKVLFTLASYIYEKDKGKAAELMKSAYDAQLVYAPADLDLYGSVLIEQKKYDEAQEIYDKIGQDNPLPANTAPEKAVRSIAEPQSIALFGTAKILQMQDKTAEAAKKFEQLKKIYPWSLKLLEADFGIAEGRFEQKEYDDALKLLGPVAKATHASTNLRAKAMLLIGKIAEERGEFEAAINNYIKIGGFFASESDLAAEGLWRGGQLLEKQANGQIAMPAPRSVRTVAARAPRKK